MTIGSGELTVVASHDLGAAGVRTSTPVVFAWHWYYHLSSLGFWALALVPLVLVRENRQLPAWTILLPLVAILLLSRMTAALFMLGPAATERFGSFVGTLATAWTIVWLLGPWFARMRGWLAFCGAATVMVGIGVVSYLGDFGLVHDSGWMPRAILYSIAAFGLLASMALSGLLCRRIYSLGRFMSRLFAWMLLAVVSPLLVTLTIAFLANLEEGRGGLGIAFLAVLVPTYLMIGGIASAVLYLFNLPFMLVAMRSPFYRQRFCQVFRLPESAGPEIAAAAKHPFATGTEA